MLNISAAVGYIAVFGVSVLNGTVLVSSIRLAFSEGMPLRDAIVRGCEIRFRPIIVSAIVAIIGFLPAALSQGIGAEIQRPLARVVIGGLISSTALTLLVLPAVYAMFAPRDRRRDGDPAGGSPG
jgi:cobalt-zinc-cadmium resistance protein CzcA